MNRRQAPSVSYPVGPCVLYGCLLLGAWCLGAVVVFGHAWHAGRVSIGAVLLLALAAGLACRAWRTAPRGHLCWRGSEGWMWQAGDVAEVQALALPVPVRVWRGSHHLLLQLAEGPRRLKWLWIERWRAPSRWDAVCRATQAR